MLGLALENAETWPSSGPGPEVHFGDALGTSLHLAAPPPWLPYKVLVDVARVGEVSKSLSAITFWSQPLGQL